jgi:photosystem II stability/assembly factor-like uncharacterized protein/predicted esterase
MKLSLAFALASTLVVAACSSTSNDDGRMQVSPDTGAPPGEGPDAGSPDAAPPPPCSGKPGTFHDQPFESGGELRHYWLHVPASYRCETPAALVVDFHGTGFGSDKDTVEESWATPDLTAASDDLGFIVVRPRSRSKAMNGGFVYQWDINPGDVAKNKAFASALVAELRTKYNVQDTRIYATGFSNGPDMAVQFLGDEPSLFHGYGLVAGGVNTPVTRAQKFGADAPRIYSMTGFRDYMLVAKDGLDAFLAKYAYPKERRFDRESDTGHEVYGWHFREAFAWMDRGVRPAPGQLKAGWTQETGAGTESLVEITTDAQGALVAVGASGGVYGRTNGSWTKRATLASIAPLTDVCFLPDGRGFAAGHGSVAATDDGAAWRVLDKVPEMGAQQFGYTYATTIGCAGNRVTVGGVWSAATSTDGGKTWSAADTQKAFVSAIRASASGWLASGYWNYAGRSVDGAVFSQAAIPGETQWWNDGVLVTSTRAIIVGEGGAIASSDDGGATWSMRPSPTKEDLYAVTFRGTRGAAVGAHGAVIVTTDGGATWTDKSTGIDGYLGGARLIDDTTLVVAGEKGAILRTAL